MAQNPSGQRNGVKTLAMCLLAVLSSASAVWAFKFNAITQLTHLNFEYTNIDFFLFVIYFFFIFDLLILATESLQKNR